MKAVFWIGLILLVVSLGACGLTDYFIDRDISSWKERAEVASDASDMLEYMRHVQDGMEDWGMTRGHAALIFKTPQNDMGLIYEAVVDHVENLRYATEEMGHGTPEYEQRVDRIQDSIGVLELMVYDYWTVHEGLLFVVLAIVGALMAFFGWMIGYDLG